VVVEPPPEPDPDPPELALLVSWNGVGLKAACLGLNRTIKPLDTSAGAVKVTTVSLTTATWASWPAPTQAAFAPVNPLPLSVMVLPAAPLLGEKDVIDGCASLAVDVLAAAAAEVMLTEVDENAEWLGLSTTIFPLVASAGTVIFNCVSLTTCVLASCPLPIHALAVPVNPLPATVITAPFATLDGEKLDMVGCG
jgi:hypothetical protein